MIIITRKDKIRRNNTLVDYDFSTYDIIFNDSPKWKPNFRFLIMYLKKAFMFGIDEVGISASQAKELILTAKHVKLDRLKRAAEVSGYKGNGNLQHKIIQNYFMDKSKYCIAVEVPVFDEKYRGRIDILEYYPETDKVGVLDFKPNARLEKKAATQVYLYKCMLSERTTIPLVDISAHYFDENNVYQVTS